MQTRLHGDDYREILRESAYSSAAFTNVISYTCINPADALMYVDEGEIPANPGKIYLVKINENIICCNEIFVRVLSISYIWIYEILSRMGIFEIQNRYSFFFYYISMSFLFIMLYHSLKQSLSFFFLFFNFFFFFILLNNFEFHVRFIWIGPLHKQNISIW